MGSSMDDDLNLTRAEWQAVSIALRDAAAHGCRGSARPGRAARLLRAVTGLAPPAPLADPRLEAVRSFVCATRAKRRPAAQLVPALIGQGFNPRQIEALSRLSA